MKGGSDGGEEAARVKKGGDGGGERHLACPQQPPEAGTISQHMTSLTLSPITSLPR